MKNFKSFHEHLRNFSDVSKSTIKMLMLVMAITFSQVLSASTVELTAKEPKTLTEEIQELLKNPKFNIEEDMFASVTLILNRNSEIVVLSVNSENETTKDFIINRLNYKKLDVGTESLNKTFVVPVKIELDE